MSPRTRARSKFSPLDLISDHYATLRDASTGKASRRDMLVFVGGPAAAAAVPVVLSAPAGRVPELLSATAIFTGLIFGAYVLMFDMTMRATDQSDPARRGPIVELAGELRANITYAVVVGVILTGLLAGFAIFSEGDKLPLAVTPVIVFLGLQMLLTVFMVLRRVRALYEAYPASQPDRVP